MPFICFLYQEVQWHHILKKFFQKQPKISHESFCLRVLRLILNKNLLNLTVWLNNFVDLWINHKHMSIDFNKCVNLCSLKWPLVCYFILCVMNNCRFLSQIKISYLPKNNVLDLTTPFPMAILDQKLDWRNHKLLQRFTFHL